MQPSETLKPRPTRPDASISNEWIDRVKQTVDDGLSKASEMGKAAKERVAHMSPVSEAPKQQGKEGEKEKNLLKKLSESTIDMYNDIVVASDMAKDTFDGEGALLHAARGFVSLGFGLALEKATDAMWDGVWQGKTEFIDRYRLPANTGERLSNLAASSTDPYHFNSRLSYFIREGSQDLAIGAVNNIIAFRAQPLLQKAEAKHLIGSLGVDAGVAFLAPSLGKDVHDQAVRTLGTDASDLRTQETYLNQLMSDWSLRNKLGDELEATINTTRGHISTLRGKVNPEVQSKSAILAFFNLSNPVSQLGVDMIWTGVKAFWKNMKEVHDARKAQGGLPGKKVEMPSSDSRGGYRERKPYDNKREYGNKPYNKDKVYYGKSQWNNKSADIKQEELLEKFE